MDSTFNPTILYNLLIGSAQAAGARNTKPIITSIKTDLRKQIEGALPVLYLYDAEVIVDSLLNALNPSNIEVLGKFLVDINLGEGDFLDFPEYVAVSKRTSKYKFSAPENYDKLKEAYPVVYNRILAQRAEIIKDVHAAIKSSVTSKKVPFSSILEIYSGIANTLGAHIHEYKNLQIPYKDIEAKITRAIRGAGSILRSKFKAYGLSEVSDANDYVSGYNPTTQVLVFATNFTLSKTEPNKLATKALSKFIKAEGIQIFDGPTGFQAGNFSAGGHVAAGLETGNRINSPLVQNVSLMLAQADKNAEHIISRFVNETEHSNWVISIKKDTTSVNFAMDLGLSIVRSQPSVLNSGQLQYQEVKFMDTELKKILQQGYDKAAENMLLSVKNNPKFYNYLTNTLKLSPTFKDNVVEKITSILGDTKYSGYSASKSGKVSPGIKPLLQNIASGLFTKSGLPKNKVPRPSAYPIRTLQGRFYSLSSLQVLLDKHLQDVISANMGDGKERSVLNYRTGRFAASAKVERLSQSRDGMVTAFYTYMKNPYQTFEPGFRQGTPKTRDPKLLISKSIREIAATVVGNKMRSISI